MSASRDHDDSHRWWFTVFRAPVANALQVDTLTLSHAGLTALPESLALYANLRVLNVSGNHLAVRVCFAVCPHARSLRSWSLAQRRWVAEAVCDVASRPSAVRTLLTPFALVLLLRAVAAAGAGFAAAAGRAGRSNESDLAP